MLFHFLENILENKIFFYPILIGIGISLGISDNYICNIWFFIITPLLYLLYWQCASHYNKYATYKVVLLMQSSDVPRYLAKKFKYLESLFILLSVVMFFAFAISLGYSAMSFRIKSIEHFQKLSDSVGPINITGKIKQFDIRDNGVRLYLTHAYNRDAKSPINIGTVRINWRKQISEENIIGRWVKARVTLMPPPKKAFPNTFDFQQHAFFRGIGAIGYAMYRPVILDEIFVEDSENPSEHLIHYNFLVEFEQYMNSLRKVVTNRIHNAIPKPGSSIISAMLVGENTQISERDYYALRVGGLAHIIAISGMHVVVVVGMVFFMIKALLLYLFPLFTGIQIALHWSVTKIAATSSILISAFYVALAGAPVSAQRALISAVVVMLCLISDKKISPIKCLCLVAIVMFLITPEALFSPGLQMSFAACFSLVATFESYKGRFFKKLKKKLGNKNSSYYMVKFLTFSEYFCRLSFASLAASTATAPFIIYHFSQFAPYGIIANLICVPLTDFLIMPLGVLGMLLIPLGLEKIPFTVSGYGIDFMLYVAHKISVWSYADIHVSGLYNVSIIVISLSIFIICIVRNTILRVICAGVVIICLFFRDNYDDIFLIISGNSKLFAVKYNVIANEVVSTYNGKFIFSSRQKERYTQEIWQQKIGKNHFLSKSINYWAKRKKTHIRDCDNRICLVNVGGEKALIIRDDMSTEFLCEQYKPNIFINMHDAYTCTWSAYILT